MRRTVGALRMKIAELRSDRPRGYPGKWYRTQKVHWMGWLSEYQGPGAYNRKGRNARTAEYAYNHIVDPPMLLWLVTAAKVGSKATAEARKAAAGRGAMQRRAAGIRKAVPWAMIEARLWRD
jgi:hypothetical protein